jgi:BASS family bile acid:Na+ symporter
MFSSNGVSVMIALVLLLITVGMLCFPAIRKYCYTVMIVAAVAISLTYPHYFVVIGGFQLKRLIVPLLQIITFGVGCTMSWRDLSGVLKMPKAVFVGTLCHYLIMPLVGFGIAKLFRFPPEVAAGIVLVGCSPSGLASNVIAFLAKANLALSVTITATSTLLAPIMTPLLMKLLAGQFVHIDAGAMFVDILKIVILPIVGGVLFNHSFRSKAALVMKIMPLVSMGGVALITVVITAAGRDELLHVGIALVAAMFLHMTAGFTLGYFGARLCGLTEKDCRTVSIEVGMQNGGLASGIAAQMGKIATVGLAPAINGPVMNTTFSLLGMWWGNKPIEGDKK